MQPGLFGCLVQISISLFYTVSDTLSHFAYSSKHTVIIITTSRVWGALITSDRIYNLENIVSISFFNFILDAKPIRRHLKQRSLMLKGSPADNFKIASETLESINIRLDF